MLVKPQEINILIMILLLLVKIIKVKLVIIQVKVKIPVKMIRANRFLILKKFNFNNSNLIHLGF